MTSFAQICEPRDQAPYLQAADEMIREGLIEAPIGSTVLNVGLLPVHARDELLRRAMLLIDQNRAGH